MAIYEESGNAAIQKYRIPPLQANRETTDAALQRDNQAVTLTPREALLARCGFPPFSTT
jgi:hypothetical protein